jgi:Icc-related predicted phosphoesterase
MRIVHFSDFHGETLTLPEGDMFFCTGDMYKDHWEYSTRRGEQLNSHLSGKVQEEHLDKLGNLREVYLPETCRNAPVAVVRGNHCFTDYAHRFGGEYYNIEKTANSFRMLGLKVGGFRGTSFISSSFSDGLKDTHKVAAGLENDLDIVMTHAPPKFIMDEVKMWRGEEYVGMPGLREYLEKCNANKTNLRLSLFGHIHEAFGTEVLGDIMCCNSATGYTVLDRNDDGSWKVVESNSGWEIF